MLACSLPLSAVCLLLIGIAPSLSHAADEEARYAEAKRLGELILDHRLTGQARLQGIVDRIRLEAAPFCEKQSPVLGLFSVDEEMITPLERLGERRRQILRVSHALRSKGVALCGDRVAPLLGASVGRRRDVLFGKEAEAEEIFGLVDQVKVLAVLPDSPADRAGFQEGDLVRKVSGQSIRKTGDVFSAIRQSDGSEVSFSLERAGAPLQVELPIVQGCHHASIMFMSEDLIPRAHPNRVDVLVPSGLVAFTRDDDELAIGIAHQMAHQLLGTTLARKTPDEPAADRLALQLAARAGFDVSKAPAFADRMVLDSPWQLGTEGFSGFGLSQESLHAGRIDRSLEIRRTVEELLRSQSEQDE
ncbi:MAG: PDZ domain-containing protein [bacterium]|nr:PDZ domain-containing protein [bacterium]